MPEIKDPGGEPARAVIEQRVKGFSDQIELVFNKAKKQDESFSISEFLDPYRDELGDDGIRLLSDELANRGVTDLQEGGTEPAPSAAAPDALSGHPPAAERHKPKIPKLLRFEYTDGKLWEVVKNEGEDEEVTRPTRLFELPDEIAADATKLQEFLKELKTIYDNARDVKFRAEKVRGNFTGELKPWIKATREEVELPDELSPPDNIKAIIRAGGDYWKNPEYDQWKKGWERLAKRQLRGDYMKKQLEELIDSLSGTTAAGAAAAGAGTPDAGATVPRADTIPPVPAPPAPTPAPHAPTPRPAPPRAATLRPASPTPAPRTPTPRPAPAPAAASATTTGAPPATPDAARAAAPPVAAGAPAAAEAAPAAPPPPPPEAGSEADRERRPIEVPPDLLIELIGAGNLQRVMGMFAEGKEIDEIETAMSALLDGALDEARQRTIEPVLKAAGFENFEKFREHWKDKLHKQVADLLAEHIKWQVEQQIEADEKFQTEKRKGGLAARVFQAVLHAVPGAAVGGAYGVALGSGGIALLGIGAASLPAFVTLGAAAAAGKITHALWKNYRQKMEKDRLGGDPAQFEEARKKAEEKIRGQLVAQAKQEGHLRLASAMSVLMGEGRPKVGEDGEIKKLRLQNDIAGQISILAEDMAAGNEKVREFARGKRVEEFLALLRLRNAEAKQKHSAVPAALEENSYWTEAMEELKKSGTLEAWQASKDWKRQLAGYFWHGVTGASAGAAIGYAGAGGFLAKAGVRFSIGAVGGGVARFMRERLNANEFPTQLLDDYIASVERRDAKEAKLLREQLQKILPKKLTTREQVKAAFKSGAATGAVAGTLGAIFDWARTTDTYKEVASSVLGMGQPAAAEIRAGAKQLGELPKEVLATGKTAEATARAAAEAEVVQVKPAEPVKFTLEQLPSALEKKFGFNPIVGKGEGITNVMMRDLAVHPERLEVYREIKGIADILERHTDGSKLTEVELKRAAGLIYNHDFGNQDLRVEEAGKVVVAFDKEQGQYRIGALDGSEVEKQLYTHDKITDNSRKAVPDVADKAVPSRRQPILTQIEAKNSRGAAVKLDKGGVVPGTNTPFYINSDEGSLGGQRAYLTDGKFFGIYKGTTDGQAIFDYDFDKSAKVYQNLTVTGPLDQPEIVAAPALSEPEAPAGLGKKIPFAGELPAADKWTPDALRNLLQAEVPTSAPATAPVVETVGSTLTSSSAAAAPVAESGGGAGAEQISREPEPAFQSEVRNDTVAPQIRERYDNVYIELATKWVDALRADKLDLGTIDLGNNRTIGGGSREFVNKIDTLLAKLSANRPIDTLNEYLMNLLQDPAIPEDQVLPVLRDDMINHLPADIRTEAKILLAENEPDHLYVDPAKPAHAFKFVDEEGTPHFFYDPDYTFGEGSDGDAVKVMDAQGKEITQITPGK